MKNIFIFISKALIIYLALILLRTLLRGMIWHFLGLHNNGEYSDLGPYLLSALIFFYELGGLVFYFILFLVIYWALIRRLKHNRIFFLTLSSVAIATFALVLMDNNLLKLYRTFNKSWNEILHDQVRDGFQFITFIILSVVYALCINKQAMNLKSKQSQGQP